MSLWYFMSGFNSLLSCFGEQYLLVIILHLHFLYKVCRFVIQHKCYIVATCDRDLKRRIRKVLLDYCCS